METSPESVYGHLPLKKWPIDALYAYYACTVNLPEGPDRETAKRIKAALVSRMESLIQTKANIQKHNLDLSASAHRLMVNRALASVRDCLDRFSPESGIPFVLYLFARIDHAVLSAVIQIADK